MKKTMLKAISLIMAAVMLVTALPLTVIAQEADGYLTDEATSADRVIEEESAQGAGISAAPKDAPEEPIRNEQEPEAESAEEESATAPQESASTYSGSCGTNVFWSLDTDTGVLVISGSGKMNNYSVNTQPWNAHKSSIDTVIIKNGVTSIGEEAFSGCYITKITVPESVNTIDCSFRYCSDFKSAGPIGGGYDYEFGWKSAIPDKAFFGCSKLSSFCFPEGIERIGGNAFHSCFKLTEINIPDSVTYIGGGAFSYCTGLMNVTIPDSVTEIGTLTFFECTELKTAGPIGGGYDYEFGWTDTIPSKAFSYCSGLTSISIPASVTAIGSSAFSHCTKLTNVSLPESITAIAPNLFQECTELEAVTISDCVISIGDYAFNGCGKLAHLTVPGSVTEIGRNTFYGCTSLKTAGPIGGGYDYEFGWTDTIPSRAFYCFYGLTSIILPDTIAIIKDNAFYECTSLESILIPGNETVIEHQAFEGCTGLRDAILCDGVTSIGYFTFYGCSGLEHLTVPGSVTEIGSNAFYGCTSLKTAGPIGGGYDYEYGWTDVVPGNAFSSCSGLTSFTLSGTISSSKSQPFPISKTSLETIIVEPGNTNFHAEGNCLIQTKAKRMIAGCKNSVIPDDGSVTSIGDSAFWGCYELKNLNIPDCITNISNYAFCYCSKLRSITIPEGVTSIGHEIFRGCTALKRVSLPGGITSIQNRAFYECSGIESVNYSGTKEQWNKISIGADNTALTNAKRYYNARILTIRYVDCKGNELFDPVDQLYYAGDRYSYASPVKEYFDPDKELVKGVMPNYDLTITVTYYENVILGSGSCGQDVTWKLYENNDKQNNVRRELVLKGTGAISDYAQSGAPWHDYAEQINAIRVFPGVTGIGSNAFEDCSNAESAEFGYDLLSIGDRAFWGCASLRSVTLPNSLNVIGSDAFSGCTSLTSVLLPESLSAVGDHAFDGCALLQKVTLGINTASIGDGAFDNCSMLKEVHFLGLPLVTAGSNIFGTDSDPIVYYYSTLKSWEDVLEGGMRYLGYTAFPINAFRQPEKADKENIYYLKVIDKNNLPLSDAVVQVSGKSYRTNPYGLAYLDKPAGRVTLEIYCANHNNYRDSSYLASATQMMDIVTLTDKPSAVRGVRCGPDSIAGSVALINCNSTEKAEIVVEGYSKYAITSYELRQGSRLIKKITTDEDTCTFSVKQNSFEEDNSVFVTMNTSDGNSVSSALNIDVAAIATVSTQQILDELGSIDLNANLGKDLGGITMPFNFGKEDSLIYVRTEGRTVRIGINLDIEKLTKMFDPNKDKSLKAFFEKKVKETLDKMEPDLKGEIKPIICGYVDIEYLGNGKYYVKTCYVKLGVSFKISFDAELLSFYGIIGVYLKATLSADAAIGLKITRFSPEEGFSVGDVHLLLDEKLDVELGLHILFRCCTASIYGNLTMGFDLMLYPKLDFESVYLKGEIGARWSALWGLIKGSHKFAEGNIYRYPTYYRTLKGLLREAYYDPANYSLLDRSYLDSRSEWLSGQHPRSVGPGDLYYDLQTGTYSDVAPRIASAGDTVIMVWLDDNPDRPLSDFQTLYYSVFDPENNTWSAPIQLDHNDTLDCEFDLISDGEHIYVIYTEQKESSADIESLNLDDPDAISAYIGTVEAAFAVFENGVFSDPVYLTDNDVCETSPRLSAAGGVLTASWSVSDNMGVSDSGNRDSVYVSTYRSGAWSPAAALAENSNTVTGVVSGTVCSESYTAYTVDSDGNSQTEDDLSLILVDSMGEATVAATGSISQISFEEINGENMLVWLCDGELLCLKDPYSGEVSTVAVLSGAAESYRFLSVKGNTLLTFIAPSSSCTDVFGIIINNTGEATEPIRLTDTSGYVEYYDISECDDALMIAFNETDYLDTIGDKVDTVTYLRYMIYHFSAETSVLSADYQPEDIIPENDLPISAMVRNNGMTDITLLKAELIDPLGAAISSGQAEVYITPGKTVTSEFTLTIPKELQSGKYTLRILPADENHEKDTADNEITVDLSYYDLSVDMEQKYINDKNQLLVLVSNLGVTSVPATLSLYAGEDKEKLLDTNTITLLKAGESQQFYIELDGLISDKDTIITCTVSGGKDELHLSNNSDTVKLFKISDGSYEDSQKEAVENPQLSENSIAYDKYTDNDISLVIESGSGCFSGISGLIQGTDYQLTGRTVTFPKSYLDTLSGSVKLEFVFDYGEYGEMIRTLYLLISDSTPIRIEGYAHINGSITVGDTVIADVSGITPGGAEVSAIWVLDGTEVSTESSYLIPLDAAGKTLSLTLKGINGYVGELECSEIVRLRSQNTPAVPIIKSVTDSSLSVVPTAGVEYSLDHEKWQDSPIFENLLPNHRYELLARYASTDVAYASEAVSIYITTLKSAAPKAQIPLIKVLEDTFIELEGTDGFEYRINGGGWQSSPLFTDLTPDTEYTFYQRQAETDTSFVGESSEGLAAVTLIYFNISGTISAPGNAEEEITVTLLRDNEAVTVITGHLTEYRFEHLVKGTYTITVEKPNCAAYTHTISGGKNDEEWDAIIYLAGDVTGDGEIRIGDYAKALAHVRGTSLMNEYEQNAADIDRDGEVTEADCHAILEHVRGTKLLW